MEERQEAAINGRRSQNSERVRAHLYEREFRRKPVSCADGAGERGRAGRSIVRHTRQCHGHPRFPPDERDMHLGRERPPFFKAQNHDRRVANAPDAPRLQLTVALSATRAAQNAARPSAAKSHTAKNIAELTRLALTLTRPRGCERTGRQRGGTLLPSLCSPPLPGHSYASCVY